MTHELKPTTAAERAVWIQYYKDHLYMAWPRKKVLRLLDDVDRLEKWVCGLNMELEARVAECSSLQSAIEAAEATEKEEAKP